MNRTIKFRAWDKEKKEMFRLGNPFVHGYTNSLKEYGEYEIMQYTGLKDKNGKEIWEGDIVIFKLFDEATPCYWEVKIPNIYLAMKNEGNHQIEVVGNVYENPNLINN